MDFPAAEEDNAVTTKKTTLLAGCTQQMATTWLAMINRWEHLRRRTRRASIDLLSKGVKQPVTDGLNDMSSVAQCYEQDLITIQETYFTIAVAMVALSIGGILGNRWSELVWAPQLGITKALLVVLLLPLRIWVGSNASLALQEHRSQLYLALLATGFSMGNLCNYSLLIIAPRILCPLVFAWMVNNSTAGTSSSTNVTPVSSSTSLVGMEVYIPIRTRLRLYSLFTSTSARPRQYLYLLVFVCCLPLSLFPVFFAGRMLLTLPLIILALSIHHCLLFVHFQLYYYGLYTLRERWQNEPMKEEGATSAADAHHNEWTMEGANRWMRNAELIYALSSLLLDVPIGVLRWCFVA